MKKRILALFMSLTLSFGFVVPFSSSAEETGGLVINEVCSSNKGENGNTSAVIDGEGKYCDWVELYNKSENDINLYNYGLSDKAGNPFKTTLGDYTVKSGEFLVVYCSKSLDESCAKPYSGIGISADGETITLTSPDESYSDSVCVPTLKSDYTFGRYPDGAEDFKVMSPTAAKSNENAEFVEVSAPIFSVESGIYENGFLLEITTDEPDGVILYTTDGSDPITSQSAAVYTAPIDIHDRTGEKNILSAVPPENICVNKDYSAPADGDVDKGTVIRACVKDLHSNFSKSVSKSYFIGEKAVSYGDIPILSVSTEYENLFDYENGIYINGKVYDEYMAEHPGEDRAWYIQTNSTQRGREWEKPCHISLIESDGTTFEQNCGMRIQGGASRTTIQKGLRFYARSDYSESYFNYPIIPSALDVNGKVIERHKTFVARSGGNDIRYLKFTDNYIQNLVKNRSIETQRGRACLMFLDGEFWGLYILQEDYSKELIEEKYGIDKDNVVMIKNGSLEEGVPSDLQEFNDKITELLKLRMTNEANYKAATDFVDLKSFVEYMLIEMYISNNDWPDNNIALWRSRTVENDNPYADGRWRFMLFDTEYSTNMYNAQATYFNKDTLKGVILLSDSQTVYAKLLNKLYSNAECKKYIVNTAFDLSNFDFEFTKTAEPLNKYYSYCKPYLLNSANRFKNSDVTLFEERVSQIKYFFSYRPAYWQYFLQTTLNLFKKNNRLNISANDLNGGTVEINGNTVPLTDSSSTFYAAYSPKYDISFKATPADGYTFVGFKGTSKSFYNSDSIYFDEGTHQIKAIFLKTAEMVQNDVDYDGTCGTKDILALRRYLANHKKVLINKAVSDINGDGEINIKDTNKLIKLLSN